jgi:hypothetical protein
MLFFCEKELIDENKEMLKEKDEELYKLRLENLDMKNVKLVKLETNEALLDQYKENIQVWSIFISNTYYTSVLIGDCMMSI